LKWKPEMSGKKSNSNVKRSILIISRLSGGCIKPNAYCLDLLIKK
jgi:hypothetical protein